MVSKPKKQTSDKLSQLASAILAGRKKPTQTDIKALAASVLSQDEIRGNRKKNKS